MIKKGSDLPQQEHSNNCPQSCNTGMFHLLSKQSYCLYLQINPYHRLINYSLIKTSIPNNSETESKYVLI